MCTVITLCRPGHSWPLLLAANRDERTDRGWDAPAAHWPEYPDIIAGRDRAAGGTWMGLNRHGVVAAVLNRPGSLGPSPGKHSRGDLPLMALRAATAARAATAIMTLDGGGYRSFNMVIADRAAVWFVRNDDTGKLDAIALTPGLHMVTALDPDDLASPRIARHLPRFAAVAPPAPPDWSEWALLLADDTGPRQAALTVSPQAEFGTVCASLMGIPARGAPMWLFARGAAGRVPFDQVAVGRAGGDTRAPLL